MAAYRDDYYAHGYLGDIYLQMGDLAHAEEEYSGSYELCPSEDTRKHLEAVRKQKQSEASSRNKRNQSLAIVMTRNVHYFLATLVVLLGVPVSIGHFVAFGLIIEYAQTE